MLEHVVSFESEPNICDGSETEMALVGSAAPTKRHAAAAPLCAAPASPSLLKFMNARHKKRTCYTILLDTRTVLSRLLFHSLVAFVASMLGGDLDLELRWSHQLQIRNPPMKLYATLGISLFLVAAVLCIGNTMQPTVRFSEEVDINQFQELLPVRSRRISLAQIAGKATGAIAESANAESKSTSSSSSCKSRVPVRYAPYFACAMSGSSGSSKHSSELFREKELIAEAEDADNKETHALSEKLVKSLAESQMKAVSDASGSSGGGSKEGIKSGSKSNHESNSNHRSSSSSSSSSSVTRSSNSAKSTVSVHK